MSVFLLMSGINIALAWLLFIVALAALQKIKDIATSQLVAPVAILSVAMIVLHLIGAADHERYGVGDAMEAAWYIVDMLAILSLIRLTKLVQKIIESE